MHTQIEIRRDNETQVVWIPVPEKTVHVGDKVHVMQGLENYREWVITQVCITLSHDIPFIGKIAGDFKFKNTNRPTIHMYL